MQLQNSHQINKPNWQQEYREALKTQAEINSFFDIQTPLDLGFSQFIPLNFANKIKRDGLDSPLGRQFIPIGLEKRPIGKLDPIGDKKNLKDGGIIHRYKSRILFTPTSKCPVICRYCFRKNELSNEVEIFNTNLSKLEKYLNDHPEVNEVILTGGDPLILSNSKLDEILKLLIKMKICFVRFHTRTPIILPKRIDRGFIGLLQKYQDQFIRINFVLHTNHADELDEEVQLHLSYLNETKIKKLTQSVLLKGVNDSTETLIHLFRKIVETDFTPYYLHHPDQVRGGMHFYLDLETGRGIYSKLRDTLPGWAIPSYIIDNSEGLGKQFAFNPESIAYSGKMLDISGNLSEY